MASNKLVLSFLFLCVIQISLAAVAMEFAPVNDLILKAQGYVCFSEGIGLMKDGEVNNNYSQGVCGSVGCGNGLLHYESCGVVIVEGIPKQAEDPTKPYPQCCNYPH
nr:uncharacterized protein LOC111413612 [Onthophagus taurus]